MDRCAIVTNQNSNDELESVTEQLQSSHINSGSSESSFSDSSFYFDNRSPATIATIQSHDMVIEIKEYVNELQMPDLIRVIQKDLSEPYSIYTYRYFIHNWPKLCFLSMHGDKCIGAIVCKLDTHRQTIRRGYIAMLAVDKDYRKLNIGTTLVQKAIDVSALENKSYEIDFFNYLTFFYRPCWSIMPMKLY